MSKLSEDPSKPASENPPVLVREGGSIGAIPVLQRAWKVPVLFMGLSLPEHGYHAPNEYFDWVQASGGIRTFAHYFGELAQMSTRKKRTQHPTKKRTR